MNCRNYKFRLYPTKEQKLKLEQTLDGCRWVYNYFLDADMSKYDMQFALTELKEREPWLYNYYSKMLQMVVHRVDAARKALASLRKNGHRVGMLHYLTHEECNAFTYNQSGFKIGGGKLWLSKIGSIKIVLHRHPSSVKQVTVCRQAGKWYAVFTCDIAKPIFKLVNSRRSVGIDVGIVKFSHDSDNREIGNPLFLKKMIKPLRRTSRKVSRRQTGSSNREKARCMLARLYERICNTRVTRGLALPLYSPPPCL